MKTFGELNAWRQALKRRRWMGVVRFVPRTPYRQKEPSYQFDEVRTSPTSV